MILTIMKLRAFARTKEIYDSAKDKKSVPKGSMMDVLLDIEFDHIRKGIDNGGS